MIGGVVIAVQSHLGLPVLTYHLKRIWPVMWYIIILYKCHVYMYVMIMLFRQEANVHSIYLSIAVPFWYFVTEASVRGISAKGSS